MKLMRKYQEDFKEEEVLEGQPQNNGKISYYEMAKQVTVFVKQ